MRRVLQTISWIAFVGTVLPSVLYLYGKIELPQVKAAMLAATAVWFAATPLWMGRKTTAASSGGGEGAAEAT